MVILVQLYCEDEIGHANEKLGGTLPIVVILSKGGNGKAKNFCRESRFITGAGIIHEADCTFWAKRCLIRLW